MSLSNIKETFEKSFTSYISARIFGSNSGLYINFRSALIISPPALFLFLSHTPTHSNDATMQDNSPSGNIKEVIMSMQAETA